MQRREFNLAVATGAAALGGCGGGGGDAPAPVASTPAPDAIAGAPPPAVPAPTVAPALAPAPQQAAPLGNGFVIGTNLVSMDGGVMVRYGASTLPNVDFTVPRPADIAWLAANGYRASRLPIRWELLQPMLFDTNANAATRALLGDPGEFHAGYANYITQVLDSHAAAGIKCLLDVHNYCRYTDFVYQSDGSVIGLVKPYPLIHAYTTDRAQVRTRIMALAPGATLKVVHYVDFMSRLAARWKGHPGLGGYGMMNEPYFMPRPGQTEEAFEGWGQDLTIWPAFAKAAIQAMRSVDPDTPIYLGGNDWNSAWTLGTNNPGWPVSAPGIVYDVHGYCDAFSSGNGVDWDLEAAKGFQAGVGAAPIDHQTGVKRLQQGVAFTQPRGLKLALTETGMPADDPRWQQSWLNLLDYARANRVEIYSWAGGNHWSYRNRPLHHAVGWHQHRTLEPQQSGPMKAVAGVAKATIFDDGGGWAAGGGSVTITVYARGALAAPVTIAVASSNGGSFSKTTLTLAAGANSEDSYTFTPPPNAVATLTYASSSAPNVPPPRKVFSLADPVAYASTSLPDAALAIVARYAACKWVMEDAHTDFVQGVPAADGQPVRAVADSGYGSSPGNAMEMLNWFNTDGDMDTFVLPVMGTLNGRKCLDVTPWNSFGLWCRKTWRVPEMQPRARNVVPYHIHESHFVVAAVAVPGATNGLIFQASSGENAFATELGIFGGRPMARWLDSAGNNVDLLAADALAPDVPAVISCLSTPGWQQLRVNGVEQGSGSGSFVAHEYGNDQMLLASGFVQHYPRDGFGGYLFAVITGKGTPTAAELQVLERYVGSLAGL